MNLGMSLGEFWQSTPRAIYTLSRFAHEQLSGKRREERPRRLSYIPR